MCTFAQHSFDASVPELKWMTMMDGKVRDLYKRFLYVGRDYPLGLSYVREKTKTAFFHNKDLQDPVAIKKAIKKGRWMVRELIGVIQLKKYRTLNSRYTPEELQDALRSIEFERMLRELEGDETSANGTTGTTEHNRDGNK